MLLATGAAIRVLQLRDLAGSEISHCFHRRRSTDRSTKIFRRTVARASPNVRSRLGSNSAGGCALKLRGPCRLFTTGCVAQRRLVWLFSHMTLRQGCRLHWAVSIVPPRAAPPSSLSLIGLNANSGPIGTPPKTGPLTVPKFFWSKAFSGRDSIEKQASAGRDCRRLAAVAQERLSAAAICGCELSFRSAEHVRGPKTWPNANTKTREL